MKLFRFERVQKFNEMVVSLEEYVWGGHVAAWMENMLPETPGKSSERTTWKEMVLGRKFAERERSTKCVSNMWDKVRKRFVIGDGGVGGAFARRWDVCKRLREFGTWRSQVITGGNVYCVNESEHRLESIIRRIQNYSLPPPCTVWNGVYGRRVKCHVNLQFRSTPSSLRRDPLLPLLTNFFTHLSLLK